MARVLSGFLVAGTWMGAWAGAPCRSRGVYADMHDGDQKSVTVSGSGMVIKPSGNNETWEVDAKYCCHSGSATVDFNVPGKPNPPPVKLLATQYILKSAGSEKRAFEFTDPSGTLAEKAMPLNHWVGLTARKSPSPGLCAAWDATDFADMHDGDTKRVVFSGGELTITPTNKESWSVTAALDESCRGMVDFKVPGKPNPPPVPLQVAVWRASTNSRETKEVLEFTDPSGTLADKDLPLNHWVALKGPEQEELEQPSVWLA